MKRHLLLLFLCTPLLCAATNRSSANTTAGNEIDVYWFDIEPFVFTDPQGKLRGIEYELMEQFIAYANKKNGTSYRLNWVHADDHNQVYESVKNSPNNRTMGVSAFSSTPERAAEVGFSPAYLPDIAVLVSSMNVPIVATEEEFYKMCGKLKAVTVANTVFEKALLEMHNNRLCQFPIVYETNDDKILYRLNNEDNLFGYVDFPIYYIMLNNGIKIKRQNVLSISEDGYGFIFPRQSPWQPIAEAFFADAEMKKTVGAILKKYMHEEVLSLIYETAESKDLKKDAYLLVKEKEIISKELIEAAVKLEREIHLRNYVLMALFFVLFSLCFLLFHVFRIRKLNRMLLLKNNEIFNQQQKINDQLLELSLKNHKLSQLYESKDQLVKVVAHDLKSPLNQIAGLIDLFLLEAEKVNLSQQNIVDMIKKSIGNQREMIIKILETESVELQDMDVKLDTHNLTELLEETTAAFKGQARQKWIYIHLQCPETPVYGLVNLLLARQSIENIISNAIKFSFSGGNIHISIERSGEWAIVKIKDEGPGIRKDEMPLLFKKYSTLSARPTGNESSTGLGLFIVKKYVEEMNGRVWCESKPGEGSCFFLMFKAVAKPYKGLRENIENLPENHEPTDVSK